MREGHTESENKNLSQKIADFDRQRDELVAEIQVLEKEAPLQERADEIKTLNLRIAEINQDQEGFILQDVEEQLAGLGTSDEDEAKKAELLKNKDWLEKSRESRAERLSAGG